MRKLFSFLTILFIAVISSACINSFAVKELNEKASAYMQKGDIKSAIARLESSVDLDDSIYESRYNLAVAYLKDDDCVNALNQIKAAESLAKVENFANVYYTSAVANNCLADKIYRKDTSEFADEPDDVKKTALDSKSVREYISYLEAANSNFEKYLNCESDASDSDKIKSLIQENNELIQTKKHEYGL